METLEGLKKKYSELKSEPADSAKPVQVKTDADYNALKPGTKFITPDGKTGTKR